MCTALVQMAHEPELPYEFFVNVVGKELPPFYEWLNEVKKHIGDIYLVKSNLKEITKAQGILPSGDVRFCTRLAKIKPMERYIGSDNAVVYYGLRADEPAREGYKNSQNITSKYPLREHGINLLAVWTILGSRGLLPPAFIFNEVVDGVMEKMGDDFSIVHKLKPWHYNQLFSGRTRQFNCFDCFYMRQYEFVWLYKYYPNHFWEAVEIEETTGADGYTLKQGISLRRISEKSDEIIANRVNAVAKVLYKLAQANIFEELPDELNLTSCGMFCGK